MEPLPLPPKLKVYNIHYTLILEIHSTNYWQYSNESGHKTTYYIGHMGLSRRQHLMIESNTMSSEVLLWKGNSSADSGTALAPEEYSFNKTTQICKSAPLHGGLAPVQWHLEYNTTRSHSDCCALHNCCVPKIDFLSHQNTKNLYVGGYRFERWLNGSWTLFYRRQNATRTLVYWLQDSQI